MFLPCTYIEVSLNGALFHCRSCQRREHAKAMADHKDPAGVGQSEIVEASTSSSSETHSPPSDRTEIWSWYAYYAGNNGLSLFNFGPAQFQNLLAQAADPKTGLLPFLGQQRSNNSIVLLSNGISFAIQAIVFLTVGSYADFGTWRPNILIFCSAVAYGIGFGWLGVTDPAKWRVGVVSAWRLLQRSHVAD